MTEARALAELFGVKVRFRRSVNIEADQRDPNALSGYVLTHRGREILRRVGRGLRVDSQSRAWSITGPYGAGKSALALFLAKVVGYPHSEEARELLWREDAELYEELLSGVPNLADGGLLVAPVVGGREPLPLALFRGLYRSLGTSGIQDEQARKLRRWLGAQYQSLRKGQEILPALLEESVQRTVSALREQERGPLGLLLVIDELGKLLEYAALHPDRSDVYHLQVLAELAARSGKNPVGMVVILHQGFEHYAAQLSMAERQEWAKVQGRFEDLGFLEPQSQVLALIGAAIEARSSLDGLRETIACEANQAAQLDIIPRELEGQAQGLLQGCAPLHPTVALVLGRLFHSRLAQNERSLFAFLTSGEPYSLPDFLARERWDGDGHRPFYRLDQLYDYVVATLGSALHGQDKKWAEIEYALDRLPRDGTSLEARLVKAIGLLGLLGDQRYLKASREVLCYALADGGGVTPGDVEAALASLEREGIVIFRQYKDAYGLWEGSDIDLGERYRRGRLELDRTTSLAQLPQHHGALRPYLAKRHFFETGTLRYFTSWVTDVDGVDSVLDKGFGPADGAVVFVLARPGMAPNAAVEAVLEAARRLEGPHRELTFFAIPKDTSGLRDALEEVLTWEWVARHTPELAGDAIARKELAGCRAEAEQRLDGLCTRLFGKGQSSHTCTWVWAGEVHRFRSSSELERTLSQACDSAYHLAPIVKNELINRRTLSSAASAGRRNLIERMLTRPTEYRLGIQGYPSELSIYLSVLRESGLHHVTEAGWAFGPVGGEDPGRIRGVWKAVDAFLSGAEQNRKPILELYATLRRAPFGVREGLLPIYLAVALLHWNVETALYENDSFVPEPDIAVLERLMKLPERFSVQRYVFDEGRKALFQAYSSLLAGHAEVRERATVMTAVRPLLIFLQHLPQYTHSTRHMSAQALAVRETLKAAREPHTLLFVDLPCALGMAPLEASADARRARDFLHALRSALLELQRAYSTLLDDISAQLFGLLKLPRSSRPAREALKRRVSAVESWVTDARLRVFIGRLSDSALEEQQWLESVATCLVKKHPRQWTDQDVRRYGVELRQLAGRFQRVEEIASEGNLSELGPDSHAVRVVRLGLTTQAGEECREIVRIRQEDAVVVEQLVAAIEGVFERSAIPEDLRSAAIAELVHRSLGQKDSRDKRGAN